MGHKRLYFIEPGMHVMKHNAIGQNTFSHLRYLLTDHGLVYHTAHIK